MCVNSVDKEVNFEETLSYNVVSGFNDHSLSDAGSVSVPW
jgi:hypothetical protein